MQLLAEFFINIVIWELVAALGRGCRRLLGFRGESDTADITVGVAVLSALAILALAMAR